MSADSAEIVHTSGGVLSQNTKTSLSHLSDNSNVSLNRSSSASYHSANYDERAEGLSPYSNSNVEPFFKRSLIEHDDSLVSSTASSSYFQTRKSATTASMRPTTKASGRKLSEQRPANRDSLQDEKTAILSRQFCKAVRDWSAERVEKILASEEGVKVDMVVDEEVRKCLVHACFAVL